MRYLGGALVIVVALIIAASIPELRESDNRDGPTESGIAPVEPPLVDIDIGAGTDSTVDDMPQVADGVAENAVPEDDRCFAGDPAAASSIAGETIIVDPGHGGDDLGTVNTEFGLMESDLVLSISGLLRDRLTESGAHVCLTRIRDRNLALQDRAVLANRWRGDAFVSIHLNRLPDPTENYTMTMWNTDSKDLELAETLLDVVAGELAAPESYAGEPNPMSPEVVRIEDLDSSMLRTARMPAVLVEAAFLSNTWEARAFLDGINDGTRWREHQIADAVHAGLQEYFSSVDETD